MLFKRSSLAFFIYLSSVVASSPLDLAPRNATQVQTTDVAADPDMAERTIDTVAAIITAGGISIQATTAVATYISILIKRQSDYNSCAVISGNIDGLNYQYLASGRNCDTTSEQKTVNDAVTKALNFMQNQQVNDACFKLTHGGTWTGFLQLAGGNANIVDQKCLSITYTINI